MSAWLLNVRGRTWEINLSQTFRRCQYIGDAVIALGVDVLSGLLWHEGPDGTPTNIICKGWAKEAETLEKMKKGIRKIGKVFT